MEDKIKKDMEEVDEELDREEKFELQEDEDFKEYDNRIKPSIFSRVWNGIKNTFSSDDEDEEDDEEEEESEKEAKYLNAVKADRSETGSAKLAKPESVNLEAKKKLTMDELEDDDMGRMIKISVGILERLPQNEFEKFKQTEEFAAYKGIIKKYKKR